MVHFLDPRQVLLCRRVHIHVNLVTQTFVFNVCLNLIKAAEYVLVAVMILVGKLIRPCCKCWGSICNRVIEVLRGV